MLKRSEREGGTDGQIRGIFHKVSYMRVFKKFLKMASDSSMRLLGQWSGQCD
jgi:hypothetical protein